MLNNPMPNDLVSREAVLAAIDGMRSKKLAAIDSAIQESIVRRLRAENIGLLQAREIIANLPAAGDERWEKLRELAAKVIKEADIQHSLYPDCFLDGLGDAINDMRRSFLSPPQQEAGSDE